MLPPTSDISHHHKVTNITMSPTSLSPGPFYNIFSVIPGAKLITIVRSIPSLYESNFGYFFHRTKEFEKAETLENFYSDPKKYFDVSNYDSRSMFARNAMAHDLGRVQN